MGTPQLAVKPLRDIVEAGHEVCLVVTQPDRPKGRGKILTAPPVKMAAIEMGLKCHQPESLRDREFELLLKDQAADLIVVVAFSILPESLLRAAKFGAINLHGSLLPKYRGAAPVQWAIARGEKKTGATVFLLDPKMDHGQIIGQKEVNIGPNETSAELAPRVIEAGSQVILESLPKFSNATITPIPQDHSQATSAPKLKKEDGKINWDMEAQQIHNRIRAFNPFPICYTNILENKGKTLRILKSEIWEEPSQKHGQLTLNENKEPIVSCLDKHIKIVSAQLEGKPVVSGKDLANGLRLEHGFLTLA